MRKTIGADAARRLGAAALISTAALLGACGTPPPDGSTTTTTVDDTACRIERQTLRTALEAYAIETNAYPASLQDLVDADYVEDPPEFPWIYQSAGSSYTMTGPC